VGHTLNSDTVTKMTLPAGKTEKFFWDDELRGFGLKVRVDAGGIIRRSWVLQYRFDGHQQRKIKLGDCAKLSVDEARLIAQRYSAIILLGVDPQVERRARRAASA
jgi:hypothetical protein